MSLRIGNSSTNEFLWQKTLKVGVNPNQNELQEPLFNDPHNRNELLEPLFTDPKNIADEDAILLISESQPLKNANKTSETDSLTTDDGATNTTPSESENTNNPTEGKSNTLITSYEDSITLEYGVKTAYYKEIDGKVYYYSSQLDLTNAQKLKDPTSTAVGIGNAQQTWGEVTNYYIVVDNSRFYFASASERGKALNLSSEEIKKLAIGREPMDLKGSTDVKSGEDAVVIDEGEKTDYYIEIDNIRYYYSSPFEMNKAMIATNPAENASGRGRVMTEWGTQTEYFIEINGSKYYFSSEADKETAQKELQTGGMIGMIKFNKLAIGRS